MGESRQAARARKAGVVPDLAPPQASLRGDRFPRIVEAVASLPVRLGFIDGEAIVADRDGLSVFELLRHRQHDGAAP
jgi:hypothetical protein